MNEPMDVVKIFVICPHCQGGVEVEQVNCAIFRHGVFRSNGMQIPPHSSQENCEMWSWNNELHGCGKPFKIIKDQDNEWQAIICEYTE